MIVKIHMATHSTEGKSVLGWQQKIQYIKHNSQEQAMANRYNQLKGKARVKVETE